jgi:hypothetical protein
MQEEISLHRFAKDIWWDVILTRSFRPQLTANANRETQVEIGKRGRVSEVIVLTVRRHVGLGGKHPGIHMILGRRRARMD